MSALNKGKHIVAEFDGIRCTVVETGISNERIQFLKNILEFNHFTVKVKQLMGENETITFDIGVTDLIFNPVIAIYERSLKTPEGHKVSPAYWNQQTTISDSRYWIVRKKLKNKING